MNKLISTGCTGFMLVFLALINPFVSDNGSDVGTTLVNTTNISAETVLAQNLDNLSTGSLSANVSKIQPNPSVKYFYEGNGENDDYFGFRVENNNYDTGNWTLIRYGHFDNLTFVKLSDGELDSVGPVTSTLGEIDSNVSSDQKVLFHTLEQFDTCVQDKDGIKTIGALANGASVEPVQTGIAGATEQGTKVLSGTNFATVMATVTR